LCAPPPIHFALPFAHSARARRLPRQWHADGTPVARSAQVHDSRAALFLAMLPREANATSEDRECRVGIPRHSQLGHKHRESLMIPTPYHPNPSGVPAWPRSKKTSLGAPMYSWPPCSCSCERPLPRLIPADEDPTLNPGRPAAVAPCNRRNELVWSDAVVLVKFPDSRTPLPRARSMT
jgi:hypothetical protein